MRVYTCAAGSTKSNTTDMSVYTTFRLRCIPYFYIAGTTKSGTTDLFDALTIHPQISKPVCKEPFYWTRIRIGGQLVIKPAQVLQI